MVVVSFGPNQGPLRDAVGDDRADSVADRCWKVRPVLEVANAVLRDQDSEIRLLPREDRFVPTSEYPDCRKWARRVDL